MHYPRNPLVSVVMAVYNEERFIGQAIRSILGQTYSNLELIIVNDGSTDGTSEIIQKYCNDNRVRSLKHSTNLGVSKALNNGIERGKGVFIARMDADDVSLPRRIEYQVGYLIDHENIGLLGTGAVIIDEADRRLLKIIKFLVFNLFWTGLCMFCKLAPLLLS